MKSNRRGQVIKINIDKNEIPRDSSRPLIIHSRFFVYETCVKKRKEKKKKEILNKNGAHRVGAHIPGIASVSRMIQCCVGWLWAMVQSHTIYDFVFSPPPPPPEVA